MKKFWSMLLNGTTAEITIFGEIVSSGYEWDDSDTSALSFQKDLKELGEVDTINLHINSPGGSVFDGVAIYQMLVQHKAIVNTYIDGLAASIASVIAMAGDRIYIPRNAMIMVHNPWTIVMGNATDLRKQADDLEKIGQSMQESYLSKIGDKITAEKLTELLNEETWLSATEAVEYGFADEILEENRVAACISDKLFADYKNVPEKLKKKTESESLLAKKIKILRGA
ncbi:head maturation protease, ClpP-related [Marinilactibacillus sp. XAAS-LB27]|uniref:head maturation protease, ClpP-related n=1 Tax=Marinilactibacillus sp. XAAS-LB27 TaxID=3114538 RepID=UPI002E177DEC|nr:head maturation protease, ClpP-related [Marinilactibacillus sp. XAAS-LB27]